VWFVPDVLSAADEAAALRAVIGAKDAEIAQLRAQLEAYGSQVEELRAEMEALRARLRQNPRNSSKPPSAEGLAKPTPRSLRKKTGRKPGRPKGQPGATLEMTGHPDHVITHEPGRCCGCGAGLFGAAVAGAERRQVTDLPQDIRAEVTEHRIVSRRCSCGTVTAGTVPAGVSAPVQYGPRVTAACCYLWHGQFPVPRQDLSGDGRAVRRAGVAGNLGAPLEAIRKALAASDVLHADETGFRVAGRLAWVHSASSGKFTLITVHGKRGREAMDAAGVLPEFRGVLVHDCWAPYDTYAQLTHALCNAHVLRELQAVTDAAPAGQWCWAGQASDAQRDIKALADASLAIDGTLGHIDQDKMAAIRHRYHSALLIGRQQTIARAGPLMRKHHALARRLLAREDDYLRYTTDLRVPFDNNAAEREIRMSKLRVKVSGCMRSMAGAEAFCAIRSYLATAAKHGTGMLDALTRAASATPWAPETA
jgi:transposase